ncbi:MAG: RagB/SusD family nutrient uptake outer membrane protein [Gemmatirosa sp.]|nr:RagB/SusD family nutrient uptake outer membrane protein [Gemmatirosa sp.]
MTRLPNIRRIAPTLLLALGSAIGAASCDNFIAPKPTDVLAPENFYQSSADAIAAVNGVYEQERWAYWLNYWYITDVATDEVIASPNFGSDGHRASNYTFDAQEGFISGFWGDTYKTINRANAVIGRVPPITMDETLKARIVGEAKFLRALSYFNLVRLFGDVPLLDQEVTSLASLDAARTPAAQVYALIVSDLQAAATALPASYSGADVGRVTSGAAQALLAKVYLTQGNFAQAATTAGQIVSGGRYSLLSTYKDNFRIATELTNSESIFELNYDGVLNPGAGSVVTLFALPASYPGGDAYGLMEVLPSTLAKFSAADKRGQGVSIASSGFTDATGRTITWALPTGAVIYKYLDQTSTQNTTARGWAQQGNNWVVLRYADVLLMYAEAVNEGGAASGTSKEAALNLVRQRAGLTAVSGLSQAAFRDSVRVERQRELLFEGSRWFDLARWGTLDATIRAKTAEVAARYPGETTAHGIPGALLPIPQGEINLNPKLTQNPGW